MFNKHQILLNEFGEESGGGGGGFSTGIPAGPDPESLDFGSSRSSGEQQEQHYQQSEEHEAGQHEQQQHEGGQQGAQQTQQTQQGIQVDPNMLLQLITQQQGQQQMPTQQQQQMDPEQVDQMLKAVKVKEDLVNTLLDPDADVQDKVAALQNYTDSISIHASTLAGIAARMAADEVHQQYGGLLQHQEEQKMTNFTESVVKQYPGLGPYKGLVGMITKQMKQEGYQTPVGGPQGAQMAAQEIVRRVQIALGTSVPGFDPNRAPQQQQQGQHGQQQQNFGGMNSLSAPGAGGAQSSSSSQGNRNQPAWLGALS